MYKKRNRLLHIEQFFFFLLTKNLFEEVKSTPKISTSFHVLNVIQFCLGIFFFFFYNRNDKALNYFEHIISSKFYFASLQYILRNENILKF